ncbi:unnamed protein product [Calypogeia fissa]
MKALRYLLKVGGNSLQKRRNEVQDCGITAAALTTSSTCSPVEKNLAKLCLQCSGLLGTAQFKTVIGATSKTALFSPCLTLSQNSFRLCVRAAQRESQALSSKVDVIDNYDSFTYNLCQYLADLGCDYEVVRNDEITIEELQARKPRGILVSPGPGTPQDSGISLASILHLGSEVPIFGVCMGLQCMGEAFGGLCFCVFAKSTVWQAVKVK